MGGTAPGEADCRDWEMKNWFRSSALPKSVVAFGKVWLGSHRSGISTSFCLSKLRSRVCNRGRLQLDSSGFPGRSFACDEASASLFRTKSDFAFLRCDATAFLTCRYLSHASGQRFFL